MYINFSFSALRFLGSWKFLSKIYFSIFKFSIRREYTCGKNKLNKNSELLIFWNLVKGLIQLKMYYLRDNKTFSFQCNPLHKFVMTWFMIFPNTVMMKRSRNNLTIKNILEGFQTPSTMVWSMTWKLLSKNLKFQNKPGRPWRHYSWWLPPPRIKHLEIIMSYHKKIHLQISLGDLRVKDTYKLKVIVNLISNFWVLFKWKKEIFSLFLKYGNR